MLLECFTAFIIAVTGNWLLSARHGCPELTLLTPQFHSYVDVKSNSIYKKGS